MCHSLLQTYRNSTQCFTQSTCLEHGFHVHCLTQAVGAEPNL